MSIIEKAVDKLMKEPKTQGPAKSADSAEQAARPAAEAPAPKKEPAAPAAPTTTSQSAAVPPTTPPSVPASGNKTTPSSAQDVIEKYGHAHPRKPKPSVKEARDALEQSTDFDLSIDDLGIEGILTTTSERSRLAEEYRLIKRPIITKAFAANQQTRQEHGNLIMLTSSVAGEGKTFTSLNLAISIAMEMDKTVLLVDADLAKPGLSRLLGIQDSPGLTDWLSGDAKDLSGLLLKTDVPKLTVLPAGQLHSRSTELLASNSMRALLDELALRYSDRVVLFDSPPLLATSEASVLAQQMGQICIIVESSNTPQYLIKDALSHLSSTESVSLILNKVKPDLFSGLGKYGYSYGRYGYGYGADD